MGTCCAAHLAAKVRDYALDAENGAVTVTVIENPEKREEIAPAAACGHLIGHTADLEYIFCMAPAEFLVSYFPKKE